MTPVKSITGLPLDPKRLEREDASKRVKSDRSDKSGESRKSSDGLKIKDTVEISSQARKISIEKSEIQRYLLDLAQSKTVDEKTAHVIRERISSGFYSKPETLNKIADVLATLPGFSNIKLTSERKSNLERRAAADDKRLEEIKHKIRNGEYESDDVLTEIVTRLLNDIRSTD